MKLQVTVQRAARWALTIACGLHASAAIAQSSEPSNAPGDGAATVVAARPQLRHFVTADDPAEARAQGLEGSVVLLLTIDESGHVIAAEVATSLGHGVDEAALAAARQFEFTPAQRDGRPVPARLRYRYRFTLETPASIAPSGPVAVLRGVVRDASNRPISNATMHVQLADGSPRDVTTDASGAFRLEFDRAGDASVSVRAEGFAPFHADESLHPRDDLEVVYRLARTVVASAAPSNAPDGDEAAAIIVRAIRAPREVTRTTLDRDEITRVPGAGGDALRSIQNLPSVARPPLLGGDLVIRGSAPGDTAIFVDGTDLPLLYHFSALSSVIPTELLDHIDFYPGNYSARYGRAMGGIVDVGLRSPRERGYHGVVTISTIDVGAVAEGRVAPNFSIALALRKSWVDAILGVVLDSVANVPVTAAPSYWDYQAIAEWRPTSNMRFRLALLGDDDSVALLFNRPMDSLPFFTGRFALATRFHIAQLLWTHQVGPATQQRALFSFGWSGTRFTGSDRFSYTEDHFPFNARYELTHAFSPYFRLHTGIDAQWSPDSEQFVIPSLNTADTATAPRIASTIRETTFAPAWYAEAEITPIRGLRMLPGLRVDYFHNVRVATVSPRLGVRYEFLPGWTVKGGIGSFTQPPGFDETSGAANTLVPGQTIGNPRLVPQRAIHYSLGFEHVFADIAAAPWMRNVSLSVEGFYKTLDDLVVATPPFDLQGRPAPPPFVSSGVGRVYGVDVLLRHRPSPRFFGWIAYTLMRSERRDTPGADWYAFDYDQTHIFTLVASYTIGWGFSAGVRFRYVTGSPSTPIVASIYNADSMQYLPIQGDRNSTRVADFHQLDLRIDKSLNFSWGRVSVFLEVLNVYNHQSQEGVSYSYDYSRSVPFRGLPIIPNLGLRGEF